jgi:hypothetical protein
MTVEDRLRAAGRAVSDQVRDVPGLDLRPEPAARRTRARAFSRWPGRRWPGAGNWLIPLAAAAAVVTVAVTLVTVKDPPRPAPQAGANQMVGAPRATGPTAAAAPVDPEALPGYFVAINGLEIHGPLPAPGQSGPVKAPKADSVIVGETLTGKRLATIAPPAGSTFAGVTGAADDRTFVLDTVQLTTDRGGFLASTQPRTWYLLKIRPGATPVQVLTPLNFPLPSGADVNGIGLSPDGTKLAVLYQVARSGDGYPYSGPFTLGIYSVATGAALRSWTGSDPYHGSNAYASDSPPDRNATLTWTSDGQHLAFAYSSSGGPPIVYLREVNLTAPGGGLFTSSAVIAKIADSQTNPASSTWCESLGITGDGRSAICGANLPEHPPVGATLDALTESADPWRGCAAPTDAMWPGFARISLGGDRLAQVLYEADAKCLDGGLANVLWSSPSGSTVLGTVSYADGPSSAKYAIVLYRHGAVTTIDWPGAASVLLANETAF